MRNTAPLPNILFQEGGSPPDAPINVEIMDFDATTVK